MMEGPVLKSGVKEIKMGVDAVVHKVIVAKVRVGNGIGGVR